MMDRVKLSRIDEELDSSEVAELCFLCHDVVKKKQLEGVRDAKDLFLKLEEKDLLSNYSFLSQLLETIRRPDLLNLLETDSRPPQETGANPTLSAYRVMLYKIYEDMTRENFEKMKFLLNDKLGKRNIETCDTALDLFVEMEKADLLSNTKLTELQTILQEFDQQLASTVQRYREGLSQPEQIRLPPHFSMDDQVCVCVNIFIYYILNLPENGEPVYSDAEPLQTKSSSPPDETEYYILNHNPRGLCVVINNEVFEEASGLKERRGSHQDESTLRSVFSRLGFKMVVHKNLTAKKMRSEIQELGATDFFNHDALVVCVLSHGEKGSVFGTDGLEVSLRELTQPFTSGNAPTLARKPKLFFIQACQGSDFQRGAIPCPVKQRQEEKKNEQSVFEDDAGRVTVETIPHDADFLMGMATVPEYKSFRNTSTGSIYIQELCRQLVRSASKSSENDDILTVLTRVNREVSQGDYQRKKQMPEPKYTLTKKLVLKFV
uniref:Caspase-8 n=1 Tax=Anabas testudineus TaxID=64144 RepID=A0A3Q1HEI1_ANATE